MIFAACNQIIIQWLKFFFAFASSQQAKITEILGTYIFVEFNAKNKMPRQTNSSTKCVRQHFFAYNHIGPFN